MGPFDPSSYRNDCNNCLILGLMIGGLLGGCGVVIVQALVSHVSIVWH